MPPKRKISGPSNDSQQTVLGGMKGDSRLSRKPHASDSEHPTFSIPFEAKEIICQRFPRDASAPSTLIFTHGAGGGIANPATALFAKGFAKDEGASAVCFQGTMNLQSRVKTFHIVIDHESMSTRNLVLGGRSMGARAAVIAMKEKGATNGQLVLASYPLVGQNGEIRDKILLDIEEGVNVLFISGDADNMCSIQQLNLVRSKMKASSWLIVIKGADHGMSLKAKDAVEAMRLYSGMAAARWAAGKGLKEGKTECVLRWDAHGRKVIEEEWTRREEKIDNSNAQKKDFGADDPTEQCEPPSKKRRQR
jgi:predicted alpha/beta-hydrolase family hydrolase